MMYNILLNFCAEKTLEMCEKAVDKDPRNLKYVPYQGCHRSWKVLEFEKCPGKSWKVLGFVNFFEKSWKSPGILHNVCPINFLFQVVYNEFSPSCYVRYSTSYFLVYLPVSRFEIYESPCYITCLQNCVFLFFAYSGVSKSPGKSWNFLEFL